MSNTRVRGFNPLGKFGSIPVAGSAGDVVVSGRQRPPPTIDFDVRADGEGNVVIDFPVLLDKLGLDPNAALELARVLKAAAKRARDRA